MEYKLLRLFILLWSAFGLVNGDCQPGFADSCFTEVQSNLVRVLKAAHKIPGLQLFTESRWLCRDLDDALNCTSDIIDTDCTNAEGRQLFDSWHAALRAAYQYECNTYSPTLRLRRMLEYGQCWNVDIFLLCVMDDTNIKSIGDLLHTELDEEGECQTLWKALHNCYQLAVEESCREQDDDAWEEFQGMTNAFFEASQCIKHQSNNSSPRGINSLPFPFLIMAMCSILSRTTNH